MMQLINNIKLIENDTAKVDIAPTDILLIDSLHTGEHLRMELLRNHKKVRKFIVLHDTTSCWNGIKEMGAWHYDAFCRNDMNKVHELGLKETIIEFMDNFTDTWMLFGKKENNNGLIVLERITSET